jgi:hypothetical protein
VCFPRFFAGSLRTPCSTRAAIEHAVLDALPVCHNWRHDTVAPYMGSQFYSVDCSPGSSVRSEPMLVNHWYPGTDSPGRRLLHAVPSGRRRTWKTLLYASDTSVSFGVKHPAGEYSRLDHVVPAGRYADNQWHHVVGTFNRFAADGMRIKLYVDGVKVLESAGDDLPILRGDNRLVVGKFSTSNFFQGDIDDVGLFNYAMTEDDVANLWLERGAP